MEIVAIVAMLEAHEVPCFVHNAGFGGLYPGPQINAYNTRAIMVPEEMVLTALELLKDFHAYPSEELPAKPAFTLRAALEFLFFGWFVPGHRNKKEWVSRCAASSPTRAS